MDTSGFKAVVDPNDDFHSKASRIWQKLASEKTILVTTNYILDETFTLLRAKCGIKTVLEFKKSLANSTPALKIIRITIKDENEAWHWFEKNWSKLSFTDCISFAVMERLNIKKVITFDSHFSRANYKVLLY